MDEDGSTKHPTWRAATDAQEHRNSTTEVLAFVARTVAPLDVGLLRDVKIEKRLGAALRAHADGDWEDEVDALRSLARELAASPHWSSVTEVVYQLADQVEADHIAAVTEPHRAIRRRVDVAMEAVSSARERGDRTGEAVALVALGLVLGKRRRTEMSVAFTDAERLGRGLVDVAMEAVSSARERGDRTGEGVALIALARALYAAFRPSEAMSVLEQAQEVADGVDDSQAKALANSAYRDIKSALQDTDRTYPYHDAVSQFEERAVGPDQDRRLEVVWGDEFEEIAVGFAALKLLGPFLEALATKLGEQAGESTGRAIRRFTVHRRRGDVLTVKAKANVGSTRVILPRDLTDEARLALIDLDLSTQGMSGATLYWDETTHTWQGNDSCLEE